MRGKRGQQVAISDAWSRDATVYAKQDLTHPEGTHVCLFCIMERWEQDPRNKQTDVKIIIIFVLFIINSIIRSIQGITKRY